MATMLELGARYGGLAFTCERDFEVVGAWVRSTPEPAWQVRFADHCHRFAFHADRLRWLVPEIAGLTLADQLVPLPDLLPLEALDPPATTADRVAALTAHWRRLASAYDGLLTSLNLVSDGAPARWLTLLRADAQDALAALGRP